MALKFKCKTWASNSREPHFISLTNINSKIRKRKSNLVRLLKHFCNGSQIQDKKVA